MKEKNHYYLRDIKLLVPDSQLIVKRPEVTMSWVTELVLEEFPIH